ncbi:MAG: hypothetical protein KTR25_19600 [Myxococcales bacterium]|nr:hypothetical protein [Myxococcales bacterium]
MSPSLHPLNLQRRAALVHGGAIDHAGDVRVVPRRAFDMGQTIFGNMHGTLPRMIMKDKLAKDVYWSDRSIVEIEKTYAEFQRAASAVNIDPDLIHFMENECDFSMEHADGTFLEHLQFCFLYASRYYPKHSANIALLHSILGSATNTFAMSPSKLPQLKERLSTSEYTHIQLFPTLVRLLYHQQLLTELQTNLHRLDKLCALRCHRVIDNASMVVDAEDLWVNLNYHLMHFVDFMPVANWSRHQSDPLIQQFRELSNFLDQAEQRRAIVDVSFPQAGIPALGESQTIVGRLSDAIPSAAKKSLARKTIQHYSQMVGHSLSFKLEFR